MSEDLSDAQALLMSGLDAVYPKGLLLDAKDRRVAGPLLTRGLVRWMGFGKVRIYSLTKKGRELLGGPVAA